MQYCNYASEKKVKIGEEGNLLWTGDEVEILLGTVRDFKADKEHEATLKRSMTALKKGSLEISLMESKARNTHRALQFLHENVLRPT